MLGKPYRMPGLEPQSAACKTNVLPSVLSSGPESILLATVKRPIRRDLPVPLQRGPGKMERVSVTIQSPILLAVGSSLTGQKLLENMPCDLM